MKKKKIMKVSFLIAGIGILTAGTYFGNIASKAEVVTEMETTTQKAEFVEDIIPDEGILTDETDNVYVELNNQLVEAIDDYNSGKITEEEYLDICKSINKQIDSKSEYQELKESELEFKSEK
jgi:hypothetical protein